MQTAENIQSGQMHLLYGGECTADAYRLNGTDVYCSRRRRVAPSWLSACEEERYRTKDMLEEITDLSNLSLACQQVIKNKGGAGVDGMSTASLKDWFGVNYKALQSSILNGNYRPSPIKGVQIPKSNGGYRQLGIPTVIDRLVQQAIYQVLSRRYERIFSFSSHGFRKGRGTKTALRMSEEHIESGFNYVVDLDMAKFFDEVNHDRLMKHLSYRIGDFRVLQLIRLILQTGILSSGLSSQRLKGTPQGSPLSPLLSNIVLDELDKELEYRGHRFVRYADDLLIFTKSEQSACRVKDSITRYLEDRLKLRVNKEKSAIRRPYELNYLGHSFTLKGERTLSTESERRFKRKVVQLTKRNRGISFEAMLKELTPVLRGWLAYFREAKMRRKLENLDAWIRRRLRCFRLKQCKRPIGIYRFCMKSGKLSKRKSWRIAASRKGWFRKALTPQAHLVMDKQWFTEAGYYSLIDHY